MSSTAECSSNTVENSFANGHQELQFATSCGFLSNGNGCSDASITAGAAEKTFVISRIGNGVPMMV